MRTAPAWRFPTRSGLPPAALLAGMAIALAALWLTAPLVEVDLGRLIGSAGKMAAFTARLLTVPDWHYLPQLFAKLLETIEITVLATAIATASPWW